MYYLVSCFLTGVFAGFMSGMFGIGGGSVRIPLLYIAGMPLIGAFGVNLVVIPLSSMIGAITHWKNIEWKIAPYVIAGGMMGTIAGAFLTGMMSPAFLAVIFAIVSSLSILGIHIDKLFPKLSKNRAPSPKIAMLGAFLINFITVLRGGSGGSLFPPFLKAIGLDIRKAIATSLFTTMFTAAAGAAVFWSRGDVNLASALVVAAGSIIGARVGSKVSLKTKPSWLEIGLSAVILLLTIMVLMKAFA